MTIFKKKEKKQQTNKQQNTHKQNKNTKKRKKKETKNKRRMNTCVQKKTNGLQNYECIIENFKQNTYIHRARTANTPTGCTTRCS